MRKLLRKGVAMMLIGLPIAAAHASPPAAPSAEIGSGSAASAALPQTLWLAYKDHFLSVDGRIIDDANGGISHSEGQGYGMLLALAAGDDRSFARIWDWTSKQLYRRSDGLASWRWSPDATPHITDTNNASDGDILIAWALADAAERWNNPAYRAAARRIALSIGRSSTIKTRYGLTLLPAASGFRAADMDDGPVVNPSYWVFPAFPRLKAVAPEVDWAAIAASGLAILDAARFGPLHLPTDWVSLKAERPTPAKAFKPVFGYNALRIPLYLAWSGENADRIAPFVRVWARAADGHPSVINAMTGRSVEPFYDAGYAAVPILVSCAFNGSGRGPSAVPLEHYYSATLYLLTFMAARHRALPCS